MTKVEVGTRKTTVATPAHTLNTRGTPGGIQNLLAQGLTPVLLQQNSIVAHVLTRLTQTYQKERCANISA